MLHFYRYCFFSIVLFVLGAFFTATNIYSQEEPTVGLIQRESNSTDVLTLIASTGNRSAYLVNNCGHYVHSWQDLEEIGFASYLTEDGELVRSEKGENSFNAGGTAGRISKYDWEGNTLWSIDLSEEDQYQQHHDISVLPNGNILALVWVLEEYETAVALGRDRDITSMQGIYMETIYEIKPVGSSDYEIVWEWNLIDHLVQDFDSTKENFGQIADNPNRFNFNFTDGSTARTVDAFHFNGIDYNADLDQILVSGRNFSEVFVIDHSTTTEEAATSSGGNSGRGGDILFRYGNPESYNFGDENDQVFFGQHDARWLVDSQGNYSGSISVYNNGSNRPGNYSTVDEVQLIFDSSTSTYAFDDSGYEIAPHRIAINGAEFTNFASIRMSGAFKLDNDNYMVCHATNGILQVVDSEGELIWEYIYPVNTSGPVEQGNPAFGNSVFKAFSYYYDYPGLVGKDLTDKGPIEINPIDTDCSLITSTDDSGNPFEDILIPTVWNNVVNLQKIEQISTISMLDIQGNLVKQIVNDVNSDSKSIDVSMLPSGMYILLLDNSPIRCVKF